MNCPAASSAPRRAAPSTVHAASLLAVVASLVASLTSTAALAHGPTRQKVTESISIDAPASAVWARIKDFSALAQWHPAISASPVSNGNAEGSVRSLDIKGGGKLSETLNKYDNAQMMYSYRAKDGGALPVTNYTSSIQVKADGNKALVEWRGAFYRGFPNNDPPPDQNDEAAVRAVTGVYKSGLENLKKLAEAK